MTIKAQDVKQLIFENFGTISRFCRLTGQQTNYHNVRKLLNNTGPLSRYQLSFLQMQERLANTYQDKDFPEDISKKEREWLTDTLKYYYHNVSRFCAAHPEIHKSNVYDIVRGVTKRKNGTFLVITNILLSKMS